MWRYNLAISFGVVGMLIAIAMVDGRSTPFAFL